MSDRYLSTVVLAIDTHTIPASAMPDLEAVKDCFEVTGSKDGRIVYYKWINVDWLMDAYYIREWLGNVDVRGYKLIRGGTAVNDIELRGELSGAITLEINFPHLTQPTPEKETSGCNNKGRLWLIVGITLTVVVIEAIFYNIYTHQLL
jgi:hypothetical protein